MSGQGGQLERRSIWKRDTVKATDRKAEVLDEQYAHDASMGDEQPMSAIGVAQPLLESGGDSFAKNVEWLPSWRGKSFRVAPKALEQLWSQGLSGLMSLSFPVSEIQFTKIIQNGRYYAGFRRKIVCESAAAGEG